MYKIIAQDVKLGRGILQFIYCAESFKFCLDYKTLQRLYITSLIIAKD